MKRPSIAFLPADAQRILLLRPLAMMVSSFDWQGTEQQNWLDALTGQGDGGDWMTDMVSRADLVLVGLDRTVSLPVSFERAWRAALQLSKVIVVLHCDDVEIPPELAGFPRCDLRDTLARQAAAAASYREGGSFDGLQSSAGELMAIRPFLEEAWEAALPAGPVAELSSALRQLESESADSNPDPNELLRRLGIAGRVCRQAKELRAFRTVEQARQVASQTHRALALLVAADPATTSNSDFCERWATALDDAELVQFSVPVRLTAVAGLLQESGPARALDQLREQWKIATSEAASQFLSNMRPAFTHAIAMLTQQLIKRFDQGDVDEVADAFDQLVEFVGQTNDESQRMSLLLILAQIRSFQTGGALRAVRAIETALEVSQPDFPTEQRQEVWTTAEGISERLEKTVETLAAQGQLAAACDTLRLLVRLRRALPDQRKLAEMLACLANLAAEIRDRPEMASLAEFEARALANVYQLEDVRELLPAT